MDSWHMTAIGRYQVCKTAAKLQSDLCAWRGSGQGGYHLIDLVLSVTPRANVFDIEGSLKFNAYQHCLNSLHCGDFSCLNGKMPVEKANT